MLIGNLASPSKRPGYDLTNGRDKANIIDAMWIEGTYCSTETYCRWQQVNQFDEVWHEFNFLPVIGLAVNPIGDWSEGFSLHLGWGFWGVHISCWWKARHLR